MRWFNLVVLGLLLCCTFIQAIGSTTSRVINKIVRNYSPNVVQSLSVVKIVRGGGATDDDDDDDDDDDMDIENSDDDEEDIMKEEQHVKKNQKVQVDSKLTKSTIVSTSKVDDKKSKDVKQTVSSTLLQMNLPSIKKSKRKSMIRIPYILRALCNPFTVIAMTRGYVASLFNLDYLKEHTSSDTSQVLRSAMEAKAKKQGGVSPRKGKRQMRPGQAKTLSDLPQLSA